MMINVKNAIKIVFGFLLLAVALIGMVVPIWPSTPFILLAIWCFSSHPKIRNYLLKNKFISDHYYNYTKRVGLKKSSVIISLSFLWVTLLTSMALIKTTFSFLLLLSVGVAVTIHIVCIAKPKININ